VGSGVGVPVGFSVGVGNCVAVGSMVKFGVGVSVANLRSAPTHEETATANRIIRVMWKRVFLIMCLFFFPPMANTSSYLSIIQSRKNFKRGIFRKRFVMRKVGVQHTSIPI
jgi:hypothetical protein